jgi:hypothetical protein
MFYQPFPELFPEIAEKETRVLVILKNHPELPADEYALIESYCNEPGCDCRRVFLNVASKRRQKIEAVITFGWESKKFYAKWLGFDDPGVLKELKGPALNSTSPQSELAPALLRQIATYVLQDKNYVERLKRHYHMFKEALGDKDSESEEDDFEFEEEDFESEEEGFAPRRRIGRNEPCPCGSGKKYKNCCGK